MNTPFGKQPTGLRLERLQASPLWLDGALRNVHPVLPQLRSNTKMPTLGEFLCSSGRRVPSSPLPMSDPRPVWKQPAESGLRATWLGHSTVLVEIDGARVLTDPVWGPRASPVGFAGPKRFQPVPLALAELPPIDVVLISHDHYDHLDYYTIRRLREHAVPFITSLGVGAHLESWGIKSERITELDWWESITLPGADLTITATPAQHFSGRAPGMRNTTLWSSFAVKGQKHALFFSGDTGLTTEYRDIRAKLGGFDLVMLEVGAFHPAWGDIHLGPENALEALELLGGGSFLPIHWGTFNLAMHDWDEPAETLLLQAPAKRVQLLIPRIGEAIEPAKAQAPNPWWRSIADLEKKQRGAPAPEPVAPEPLVESAVQWPLD